MFVFFSSSCCWTIKDRENWCYFCVRRLHWSTMHFEENEQNTNFPNWLKIQEFERKVHVLKSFKCCMLSEEILPLEIQFNQKLYTTFHMNSRKSLWEEFMMPTFHQILQSLYGHNSRNYKYCVTYWLILHMILTSTDIYYLKVSWYNLKFCISPCLQVTQKTSYT